MTEKVHALLKDSMLARWSALILLSAMMFFAYMFVDVLSPLKTMIETGLGWSSSDYGIFTGSEYFLNVFAFFLIFAGIILDKMGIRFTAILSAIVMVVGASIKYYAISDGFAGSGIEGFLSSFIPNFPASAKLACVGFAIFGCGVEMAGITVSKAIVKWFNGKELALAMGIEMAIARLGVFAVFRLSPRIADKFSSFSAPVLFCLVLLLIGALCFFVYTIMDKKLDKQVGDSGVEPEEPFKISDIGKLFTSKTFLIVAGLCVLYYSAIFPFQKFAANMLESRLQISSTAASDIFSYFPIGAMVLTPLLGAFLDNKGKGATMLIIGAVLMCLCHLTFALVPAAYFTKAVAFIAIIVLGVSFSLVPAALWPSVPKLVENRYLGSAYSVIFWIQNIGLMLFPMIIGASLDATNPNVTANIKIVKDNIGELKSSQANMDKVYTLTADMLRINQIQLLQNNPDEYAKSIFTLEKAKNSSSIVSEHIDLLNLKYYSGATRDSILNLIKFETSFIDNMLSDPNMEMVLSTNVVDDITAESVLTSFKSDIENIAKVKGDTIYNYRVPMLIFASLGILAFILGLWLKAEDRRKKYGLELPNIKKD